MSYQENIHAFLTQLPTYQAAYKNQVLVIKYGGNAMTDASLQDAFAQDIALLSALGFKIVVVHGGGPQIDAALQKIGQKGEFIHGYRVTDENTLQAVEWALLGQVQPKIVQLISKHLKYLTAFKSLQSRESLDSEIKHPNSPQNPYLNLTQDIQKKLQQSLQNTPKCIGLSGRNHDLICATKMYVHDPEQTATADNQIDIGWVGRVIRINHSFLEELLQQDFIPVIAPIGLDESGDAYNINADLVAAFVARALNAKKLVMMSNIAGVLDADKQRIPYLNHQLVQKYIKQGVISGGMIPKIASSLEAIDHGVKNVHIMDGREPHLLLKQFASDILRDDIKNHGATSSLDSIGTIISLDELK
jgi:acetylglutamate kinase